MGFSYYSSDSRTLRASTMNYASASVDKLFVQQSVRKANEGLMPTGVTVRECRDSEAHPNAVPIIFGLDVTGSMGRVPEQLIRSGLPTLMTTIIDKGVQDASVCFVAVGDEYSDSYPLQVAQFESGDAELDHWLTRIYLEGNGGGNGGESYGLVWDFALNHVATDAWDKRQEKGYIFTVGDEPIHRNIKKSSIKALYESTSHAESDINIESLLEAVKEKWNVYHFFITETRNDKHAKKQWQDLLGENCIIVDKHEDIPNIMAGILVSKIANTSGSPTVVESAEKKENKPVEIL